MNNQSLSRRIAAMLTPQMKSAFLACVLLGFLTHLFAFTNIIPNSDGLSRVFDEQQMTISGRWFLHYASMFHGFIQAPALIGALSLVFLGTAAALSVDVLALKSRLSSALCGSVMALFPAVAYTYLYMFTASAYALAIALAVLSVWLTQKYPKWFLAASIPLACSIGTYQAYFSVAAALALSRVILDLLDEEKPLKTTILEGFRILFMLGFSALVYYLVLQIFLNAKGLTLLTYLGMDEFGSGLTLGGIIAMILDAYKKVLYFFLSPGSFGYNTTPLILSHLALLSAGGFSLVTVLVRHKALRAPGRIALIVLGCGLMPLACNFTQLLSEPTPIMRYGLVTVYLLLIAFVDTMNRGDTKAGTLFRRVVCVAMATVLLLFAQISNLAYTASATAHRATETFSANLVGRVEATAGYCADMEVVIIGSFPDDVYYSDIEAFRLVEHYSCMSSTVMQLNKHVYAYLNDWLNIPWQEPSEDTFLSVSASDDFAAMPLYPSDGSVQIINGKVVVKLAEKYTPKLDYEIAYENRK